MTKIETISEMFERLQNAFQVHHPKFPFPKKDLADAPESFQLAFRTFAGEMLESQDDVDSDAYDRGKDAGLSQGRHEVRREYAKKLPVWLWMAIALSVGLVAGALSNIHIVEQTQIDQAVEECLKDGGQFMATGEEGGSDTIGILCVGR